MTEGDVVPTISFGEIVQAGGWQSAFFTTYSLSLSFFEAVVLQGLRAGGVRQARIAVDLEGYRASLGERGVTDAGRLYDVVPLAVSQRGIFHPKLVLLSGKDGPRAAIGSGNLTFRGWGRNAELAEYLSPAATPRAFGDLADFLELLSLNATTDGGRIAAASNPVPDDLLEACRAAGRGHEGGAVRILHSLEQPMVEAVVEVAADLGGATALTVVSPYFGGAGAVVELASRLGCDAVSVLVPAEGPERFDFAGARAAGLSVRPVASGAFADPSKPLHAKLLEVVCRRGRLLLSGSANATRAALLGEGNVELGVLRIATGATRFGWRSCAEPAAPADAREEDILASSPCLAARLEGDRITGRVLGAERPGGLWRAALAEGPEVEVRVEDDGRFSLAVAETGDPLRLGRAAQLVLARDAVEAAGWLVLDGTLAAIRERGPVAEAVVRLLAGAGDAEDVAAILGFFAEHPEALLDGTLRSRSGERDGDKASGAAGLVVLEDLRPSEAADLLVSNSGGASAGAFDRLLALLRRDIVRPDRQVSGAVALALSDPRADDPDAPSPERVPRDAVESVLEALFGKVTPAHPLARERLPVILPFLRAVAGNVEEPDLLVAATLRRWRDAAMPLGAAAAGPDELDRCFVAVVVADVIVRPARAALAHEALQAWCGGALAPSWAARAAPRGEDPLEAWLASGDGPDAWAEAWSAVLGLETSWDWVRRIEEALRGGGPLPPMPASVRLAEAETIRDVAAGMRRSDRVLLVRPDASVDVCPRCHISLPRNEAGRLRAGRVATAPCCGRVLLNVGLRR
ncbi:hypothetical protein E0493_19880 [Roseomonas sp. M0104]|uniref:Phospholipase D-like domain-containing protein n=1 Tax=Teichococcus coralli TaxID=2545983 RepID=A0A845BKC7_9PROT|nr:hypothetical protein [Pseudoroseomonas coralli]MXP65612.1 hypothetical protein [Pseudoroseomonas coralli]